jgi:hypothetical protein
VPPRPPGTWAALPVAPGVLPYKPSGMKSLCARCDGQMETACNTALRVRLPPCRLSVCWLVPPCRGRLKLPYWRRANNVEIVGGGQQCSRRSYGQVGLPWRSAGKRRRAACTAPPSCPVFRCCSSLMPALHPAGHGLLTETPGRHHRNGSAPVAGVRYGVLMSRTAVPARPSAHWSMRLSVYEIRRPGAQRSGTAQLGRSSSRSGHSVPPSDRSRAGQGLHEAT